MQRKLLLEMQCFTVLVSVGDFEGINAFEGICVESIFLMLHFKISILGRYILHKEMQCFTMLITVGELEGDQCF